MKRILEVQIGTHFLQTDRSNQRCKGSGRWSSRKIDHILRTGSEDMWSSWSVECPQCRKVVQGFDSRRRLPIKEMVEKILRIR